jgi:hypothetical protein
MARSDEKQLLIKIRAEIRDALRSLDDTANRLDRLGRQGKKAAKDLKDTADSSKQVAAGFNLLRAAAAGALASISVGNVTRTLAEFDRLNASLKTVTGSLEGAQRASAFIRRFATETPYELSEVTEAFIQLRSLGLDTSERAMRSMGNTASAMGKPLMQFIEAVADASTGEFERLKEFGIKASQEGDKVTFTFRGASTTIRKEAGAIQRYLLDLGETDFAGGMADQMDTIGGKLSNLQDAFSNFVDFIGNLGIRDALKKGFEGATEFIQTFQQQLNAIFGSGISAQRDFYELQLRQSRRVYNQLLDLKKTPLIGDLLAPDKELAKRERDLRNLEETIKTLDTLRGGFDKGPPASPAPAGGGTPPPDKAEEARRKREAEAAAREARQAALAEIEARLRLEEDASRREEEILKGRFDRNLIGYQDYYTRLAALRQQDIDHQIAAKQAELDLAKDRAEQTRLLAELTILERQRADIVREAADGIATAREKETEKLKQQRDELDNLIARYDQQFARQRRFDADARKVQGSDLAPEQKQFLLGRIAEEYAKAGEQVRDTSDQMSQFARRAAENMQDAFADFLFDPFQDGIEGMALSFANTLRRMAAEALSQDILGAIFGNKTPSAAAGTGGLLGGLGDLAKGGGGIGGIFSNLLMLFGFDEGGYTGPGGRTQAAGVVHKGEYVFSAPSVGRLGVGFLDALHGLTKGSSIPSFGYANGGIVDQMAAAGGGQSSSIRIINTVDPNLVHDYLSSPAGERVIVNHIQRNAGKVRQIVK